MTKTTTPNKFGGTLGEVKTQILQLLLTGKRNRFDIAMHLSTVLARPVCSTKLSSHMSAMLGSSMVTRIQDGTFEGFAITNTGRAAIGVTVPLVQYRPTRICNALMPNCPDVGNYTHMGRIGLAACGTGSQRGAA